MRALARAVEEGSHFGRLLSSAFLAQRGVKKQANEVRAGELVELQDSRLYVVEKHTHTHGHGRQDRRQLGNVHLDLRDVDKRTKRLERKRPYNALEVVQATERALQFLYAQGGKAVLMDLESYEQPEVELGLFGPPARFLTEGLEVTLKYAQGRPVSGLLPATLRLEVTQAEPYSKGNSVSAHFKECTVAGGAQVKVPPYVQAGDSILVNTETGEFLKRGWKEMAV